MRRIVGWLLLAASACLCQPPVFVPPPARQPAAAPRPAPPARSAPVAAPRPAGPLPRDLKFPPLRPIPLPHVERFKLSNGMKVMLIEDHELPVVSGSALVRTGNLFDTAGKPGVASLTGMVIRSGGADGKSADQISAELDNLAAQVESGIGESFGSVSFSALKPSLDPVLAIFKEVLTAPEFRADPIDQAKAQLRNAIARRNDVPQTAVRREFADNLYGKKTPYGWREDYDSLNRIYRADLQAFYRRYYFPANVLLAVQGDFDTAVMKAGLERLFAGWTAQQPDVPPFPKVDAPPGGGLYTGIKSEYKATHYDVGQIGGELRDKDCAALEVMAGVLGGGAHSRLSTRLPNRPGVANDVRAEWAAAFDHPGLFEITGSTESLTTEAALKVISQEVERIRTAEVSDEELRIAKDATIHSLVLVHDTKAKMLLRLMAYEYYGYPADFAQQHTQALAAVTRADVLRVARQHLDPAQLTSVLLGNQGALGPTLQTFLGKKATPIDLNIQPTKAEAVAADAGSIARGKQMLARAQAAAGGGDRLAAVQDYILVRAFAVQSGPTRGSKVSQTERWMPGRIRLDNTGDLGDFSLYCAGPFTWGGTSRGSGTLSLPQARSLRSAILRSYFQLLVSDRVAGRTVSALDDDTVEISDGVSVVKVEFDRETHLPARILYDEDNAQGMPVAMQDVVSDYRDVEGMKVPFDWKTMQGSQPYLSATVTSVKVNQGLKVDDLEKRP